jgi:ubiquinone/menaquinone biosynthesis C-methylase UbiE
MLEGRVLESAFEKAAPEHYEWQTTAHGVAEHERALVKRSFEPLGTRVLDLGCGEGATLFHLGEPPGATGLDLFPEKIAFARERLPRCNFVVGSVYELPFDDGSFDHVLVRDVIHHLDEPARLVGEVARVLSTDGRLDVLEPCRYNPLIFAHALAVRAERGELRSTARFLKELLGSRFDVSSVETFQGLPLHRLVFHPDLGRPGWAHVGAVKRLVDAIERLADSVVPRFARAYIHLRARKSPPRS